MSFCAIIAEFNPPTMGHRHIIEEAKRISKQDILCITSGNVVQRGEFSCIEKYKKAELAIKIGADVVIELPAVFSLSSAEDFAYGAVKVLSKINSVKSICFGSECGNLEILEEIADFLIINNQEYTNLKNNYNCKIKENLKKGLSYAESKLCSLPDKYKQILKFPNNLLGVYYIIALKKLNSKITPFTIKRIGNYNEENLNSTESLSSAKSVRTYFENYYTNTFFNNANKSTNATIYPLNGTDCNFKEITNAIPEQVLNTLKKDFVSSRHFDKLLLLAIRIKNAEDLKKIAGVVEGLENRLKSSADTSESFAEFLEKIKTRRYPIAKLKRILVCNLLNITNKDLETAKKIKPYIRVLAINKDNKKCLTALSKSNCTLLTQKKDYEKLSKNQLKISNFDLTASSIISTAVGDTDKKEYKIGTKFV